MRVDGPAVSLVAVALAGLVALILISLRTRRRDDGGDGRALVLLPVPRRVHALRLAAFFLCFLLFSAWIALDHGAADTAYASWVLHLALFAVPSPTGLAPYATHLEPSLRLVIAGSLVALGLVLNADPWRRLEVVLHAVLYLVVAVLTDTLVIVAAAATRLPIGFYGLEGIALNVLIGGLVMLHVFFTTFQLPRPTTVPRVRGAHRRESLQLALVGVAVLAAFGILVAVLASHLGTQRVTLLVISFSTYSATWTALILLLLLLRLFMRPPPVGAERPPLHVIMPAYNESAGIVATLLSIERAAAVYGGPVRLTVADDGSTDDTFEVVTRTMAGFQACQGEVVSVAHAGKSPALNAALARVESELAVRIDADVVVDAEALLHAPRWFRDPAVGMVGAMVTPQIGSSWIHRMRLIECLSSFFFARLGMTAVDAVSCIPGTFQAFRVAPARAVGGNVVGMNGEDADLTLQLGRLGYRVVVDPKIRVQEDVPNTVRELRAQRTRWYRAGAHIFARHGPVFVRSAGPKIWFSTVRLAALRFMAILRPVLFLYSLVLAVTAPTAFRNLLSVFLLYGASVVPVLVVFVVLAARWGFARYIPWMVLWYPTFVVLRRAIVLESFLTLPTRAGIPGLSRSRAPARAGQPSAEYQTGV